MSSPKGKPECKKSLQPQSSAGGTVMVGVLFEDGVVLVSMGNVIYYLDDRIYCCASSACFDRECLIEISTKLEDQARTSSYRGASVAQALDLLVKLYEQAETAELLLAGEDASGLHLITLRSNAATARVNYAAMGAGTAAAAEYLKCQWRPALSLKQAEQLARKAIVMGTVQRSAIDLCIVFKRTPEPVQVENGHESP